MIEVEIATLSEEVGTDRRSSLRRRPHERDRVLSPEATGFAVGNASPQVNDALPVDVEGASCPKLQSLLEIRPERVGNHSPPLVYVSVNQTDRRSPTTRGSRRFGACAACCVC